MKTKIFGWITNLVNEYKRLQLFPLFHVVFEQKGRLPRIKILSHTKYIEIKEQELAKLRDKLKNDGEFIESALEIALSCSYIIFNSKVSPQFIQYAVEEKELILDFPVQDFNAHDISLTAVIRLLEKYGFKENKRNPESYWAEHKYIVYRMEKGKLLNAEFCTDVKLAGNFTQDVFLKIFKLSLDDIKVILG